jgi:adenylosuccinate lyase
MIERYALPEMAAVWSERRKLDAWQEVEALALEGWEAIDRVPDGAGAAARAAPAVEVAVWKEREAVTHHDLAAFVDVLAESMAEHGEWLHYGLTSSDVLDTAQGALLAVALDLLLDRVEVLFAIVRRLAFEHRDTVMVGRTHGIWAEPTSFGLKLASWAFELQRDHERLTRARQTAAVGKISGAVGSYAHVPPEVEAHVCGRLRLAAEPASTQVTARDRHAEVLSTLALCGATLERFATEIRHLQRSEVGEAMEPFGGGQKGSSAMPHKRNPIRTENVTGLARLLRGYAQVGLENVALWHERDISHSSAERVAIPDACLALDFALDRMTSVIEGLVVDAERMQANLDATRGLVYSQAVLLALVDAGWSRDEAYRKVQKAAMKAWDGDRKLRTVLKKADLPLSADELGACFDPARHLANAAVVFDRLEAVEL